MLLMKYKVSFFGFVVVKEFVFQFLIELFFLLFGGYYYESIFVGGSFFDFFSLFFCYICSYLLDVFIG